MSSVAQRRQDIKSQTPEKREVKPAESAPRTYDSVFLFFIAGLCFAAWYVGRYQWYEPGSDLGYQLGLVGGSMMVLLLFYPIRKRIRFMRAWLPLKHWFRAHMFLGVVGPVLVLFHTNVQFSSITGGVALICTIAVFASGLIGRVIYTRIHRGLYGRRIEFDEVKSRLGMTEEEMHSKFHFAPKIEKRLQRFENRVLANDAAIMGHLWSLPFLSIWSYWVYRRTFRDLKRLLKVAGKEKGWSRRKYRIRSQYGKSLVKHFLESVRSLASFHAYERLFSLWHIAHVPLIFLLVIAGSIHVLAVHMY